LNCQDIRISQTPYHSLTSPERAIFAQRKELLAYIAKRFREEVSKYEEILRSPTPIPGIFESYFILSNDCLASDPHIQTPTPTNLLSRNTSFQKEKSSEQIKLSGEFRYCATCGRSSGVHLTICKRCRKTSFCSKTCKIDGWNQFHRYECRILSTPSKKPIHLKQRKILLFYFSCNSKDFLIAK